jgi:hypothetical protein
VYKIVSYDHSYESQWDNFIHTDSVNSTFLQSRNFLNYHPKERFVDISVLLFKENVLVAVVPGCSTDDEGKKTFFLMREVPSAALLFIKNIMML